MMHSNAKPTLVQGKPPTIRGMRETLRRNTEEGSLHSRTPRQNKAEIKVVSNKALRELMISNEF